MSQKYKYYFINRLKDKYFGKEKVTNSRRMRPANKINILNKRVRFEYEILEEYEAGIMLTGTEIKSIRMSKASIAESFCEFVREELYVINMSIEEYKFGTFYNHKVKRERKLLLHKQELNKLEKRVKDVGNTIIPLKLYINAHGKAKLLIALARGTKLYDKRETIKERENKRSLDRIMKKY